MTTHPLIGITAWTRGIDTALGPGRPAHTLGVEYAEPIESRGAAVVLLVPTHDVDTVLDRLDGLVLSGGDDIDPARYGREREPGGSYDAARDEFEIALIRGARDRGLPTLAICRGLQVTNVAFGGTLVVDLEQTVDHATIHTPEGRLAARHSVVIEPDSRLAALYGRTERIVNTIHHQAVDRLAPGLRVVARASDGTVEAIEVIDADGHWPFWAVQWHPEKMAAPGEAVEEGQLFDALVAVAAVRVQGADSTTARTTARTTVSSTTVSTTGTSTKGRP